MRRCFAIFLILTFSSLGVGGIPLARADGRSGKFIIYAGEKESGSETWSVSESEGKIKLSDRSAFQVMGQDIIVKLDVLMDSTLGASELNVSGKAPAGEYRVNTKFTEGKAISHLSGIQDTTLETQVHKDVLILPNGVFFPYTFLVQRYDLKEGGTQEFFAYVVPVEISIKVDYKGEEKVSFADAELELKKFFVNLGGQVGVYVWANDAGEVVSLSIPMQGIEVFKEGYKPASAKAEADTLKKLYASEDVTFKSGNLKLAGTVTVPQDGRAKHPAAIIISGSGPQDRDGKTPDLKFSLQYKALAHTLSNFGILVLRYDDRGVGKSEGNFETASLSDFVSDVKAGISYLRLRPDVDKTRICLIGHSEGAIIAPMIASEDTVIKAIVLMAGTARPLDQVILEQQDYMLKKQNVSEDVRKHAIDQQKDFFAWVRGEKQLSAEQIKQLGKLADQKKWLLEHFQHDPIKTIKTVKCRVLIVQGGKDRQVFEEHARMLNQALDDSGNRDHTLKVFPDLDHLFCKAEGEGDYAEYATERPLDQEFLNFLTDWLKTEL
ncbi:MAG: alpha/beta fold hydrolase [Candidatus Zixiibacteriota bacterium]